jgi:hypothetical protein
MLQLDELPSIAEEHGYDTDAIAFVPWHLEVLARVRRRQLFSVTGIR